jgi:putative FmdB family regulatory protein
MPIYQYKCKGCDKEFEELVPIKDREDIECPDCGEKCDLIPSGGHFELIGTWYKTSGTY